MSKDHKKGCGLVNDVDKIVCIHNSLDQLPGWRVLIITLCPVISEPIRFILLKSTTVFRKW